VKKKFHFSAWKRAPERTDYKLNDKIPLSFKCSKGKGIPQEAEVALGVPGRLRSPIFSTLGTTKVVDRQTNAPAASTPGEIAGIHFQGLSRPRDTWFCRKEPRKKSLVTPPGIDPGTVRLVAQRFKCSNDAKYKYKIIIN
jgi:hypothetical protein